MNIYPLAIAIVYTAIILSLIWARFCFFKITTSKSKLISYVNDPAVFTQLIFTYGLLWRNESIDLMATVAVIFVYLVALSLFWWAIRTAGTLDFASSDAKGQVFTTGAFGLVRHPFYLSYMLVWVASSVLLNSVFLWLSCALLVAIYVSSARAEENSILRGEFKKTYDEYKSLVGMFIPKRVEPKELW